MDHRVKKVAHFAGVAKVVVPFVVHLSANPVNLRFCSLAKRIAFLLDNISENLGQLLAGVIIKMNVSGEARFQAGVAVDKIPDFLLIAGHNNRQAFPLVLHFR